MECRYRRVSSPRQKPHPNCPSIGQAGSGALGNLLACATSDPCPPPQEGAGALTPPVPPKCNLLQETMRTASLSQAPRLGTILYCRKSEIRLSLLHKRVCAAPRQNRRVPFRRFQR